MYTYLRRIWISAVLIAAAGLAAACPAMQFPTQSQKSFITASSPMLAKAAPRIVPQETGRKQDLGTNNMVANLTVAATQPSDGAVDVDPGTQILVVFNRPVVPLTGVDAQADLPDPLSFEPQILGEGQWINTSVYAFQPATALDGATTYRVTVTGVTALGGEKLVKPYAFTFGTTSPIVISASPTGDRVAPATAVSVQFSQPMDLESAARAFHLSRLSEDGSAEIEGRISLDQLRTTLVFTPSDVLGFGESYSIDITEEALAASGKGALREPFTSFFSVAPFPDVLSVTPADGSTSVSPDKEVVIRFNTNVSRTQVAEGVSVTPVLTTTYVYSYYSAYNNELTLGWYKEPQTVYTVTIAGSIEDDFGNTLGTDRAFSFTTGDYTPYVDLELERFTHFTASDETRVSLLYRNVDEVRADLYRLPEAEILRLAGGNQWEVWNDYAVPNAESHRIWRRDYDTSGAPNVAIRQIITITDAAGDPLPSGTYFLSVNGPPGAGGGEELFEDQAAIVLSDASLVLKKSRNGPSLAWLTDLATGEPIADSSVRFFLEGRSVGQDATEADGSTLIGLDLSTDQGWAPVIAISSEPGEPDYAIVSSDWNSGIAAWDFGLNSGWGAQPVQAHFYTDRPIYKPGDTVHWKGIIRTLVDDEYSLPSTDLPVAITVRDDMGNVVQETIAKLSDMGTVFGEVVLSPEATTGYYYLSAVIGESEQNPVYSGIDFQVASYRKPEFEITVASSKPEYVQGDTVVITANARYFSGGPLADAPVTWRLIADPYYFAWSDDEGRYYTFSPFDPDSADRYDPYRDFQSLGLINEGGGVTDADGSFVIELPADISRSFQSQRWVFDVTIQSTTNQFVSGLTAVPVHRAAYYIGLSPTSYVVAMGETAEVGIVTITPDHVAYPGAGLDATVYEVIWSSVYEQSADGGYRWESNVERTPVFTSTVTSGRDGKTAIEWAPTRAGQYQVAVRGQDEVGNPVSSVVSIWVSSVGAGDFVAWPMKNNDRIEIVADKSSYTPGDVARILVPSPYQGPVQALVTQERAGVIDAEVISLSANSETLEVPISEKHIPNVFVSVILAKGVDETNPFPSQRVGYVMLTVDTSQKELTIDIEAPQEQVQPGSVVSYTLAVSDSTGRPISGAEVSVALIDKAVLSLSGATPTSLMDAFYVERPLDVVTGASLIINQDRMSQQLSEGAKGGGGGGGGGALEVRSDFSDVALWKADFRSDDEGEIRFHVTLPDSLTTWTLVARAVTDETLVGDATSDIVASKDLQVRPLVPRFFTAGDRPFLGAQIINTSEFTVTGVLTYTLNGAQFSAGDSAYLPFVLGPGDQTAQTWPAAVSSETDELTVLAVATARAADSPVLDLRDGVRLSLPVHRYESPETVASSGEVPPSGTTEHILVPAAATDTGQLRVRIEPSLAAGMLEGLDYLQHFPYECNEQTVSRFLPNLVTVRALNAMGIDDDDLRSQLSFQLGIGVQRLVGRQNPDGGWGYWPGERSSPFISAYVLWGLSLAGEQEYPVPPMTISSAIGYLEAQFQAPHATDAAWKLNEMAFTHYVLSSLDAGDPGRASTLYDVRERLGIYGQSLLAMALDNMSEPGSPDARVQTLLDDVAGAALLSAAGTRWEEAETDYWTLGTDTRSTSIALTAFARLRPDYPVLPQVVRWLMATRDSGRWSNTQENAWAVIGLTDWMLATGELKGDYDWNVTLNESELGSGTVSPGQISRPQEMFAPVTQLLRDEANNLAIGRTGADGRLYYTTDLQYYLDATAIDSRDHGIVIGRRFASRTGGPADTIGSARVGDVISVTVTIVAPTDLYQVLVEAPIPAGVEPIDPRLATTDSQFEMPSVEAAHGEYAGGWWRHWVPTHTDYRDDKVALFASYLPAGTYEYTFNARASMPGEYRVLPAYAEMMYFNDVWGRSQGDLFVVKP